MSKRKAPDSDNPNQEFVDFLFELAINEKNVARNVFKAKAYEKAASVLSKLPQRIKSGDEARKLDGIGAQIGKKIDEFIATGGLKKLEKIRNDGSSSAIILLTRVAGIGPAKARELVIDSGIETIEDLRENQETLTKGQMIGLKHFEDFEKRIPRDETIQIEAIVVRALDNLDPKYGATICGSYRRGLPTSGDIDILLTHKDFNSTDPSKSNKYLKEVVKRFEKIGLITDTLSHGDTKFMGVCKHDKLYRRLDIRLLGHDQYYCGVLYFTGSPIFNTNMRSHALDIGFTLNEYSLRPMDQGQVPQEPLPVTCEEDLFDYLSMDYKEPHQRSL